MTDFYIEQILQKLHIRKRYCGYRLLFRAVALALEDEARLLNVKNQIYQPIAPMAVRLPMWNAIFGL